VRKDSNDAIFTNSATDAGKVILTKLSWYMHHVLPALEENTFNCKKQMNQKQLSQWRID